MKKYIACIIIALALAFCASKLEAQISTVSATVQDSTGQVFANGSYRIEFVKSTLMGSAYEPVEKETGNLFVDNVKTGVLDGNGYFSTLVRRSDYILPSGGSWRYTICPAVSSSSCVSYGSSLTSDVADLSSVLSTAAGTIQVRASEEVFKIIPKAYKSSEIVGAKAGSRFYNLTEQKDYIFDGTTWNTYTSSFDLAPYSLRTNLPTDFATQSALNPKAGKFSSINVDILNSMPGDPHGVISSLGARFESYDQDHRFIVYGDPTRSDPNDPATSGAMPGTLVSWHDISTRLGEAMAYLKHDGGGGSILFQRTIAGIPCNVGVIGGYGAVAGIDTGKDDFAIGFDLANPCAGASAHRWLPFRSSLGDLWFLNYDGAWIPGTDSSCYHVGYTTGKAKMQICNEAGTAIRFRDESVAADRVWAILNKFVGGTGQIDLFAGADVTDNAGVLNVNGVVNAYNFTSKTYFDFKQYSIGNPATGYNRITAGTDGNFYFRNPTGEANIDFGAAYMHRGAYKLLVQPAPLSADRTVSIADSDGTIPVAPGTPTVSRVVCWKTATTQGFCSTATAADGSCTCN